LFVPGVRDLDRADANGSVSAAALPVGVGEVADAA
jgi:hypothetical protein